MRNHGPIDLPLTFVAELGFAWDADKKKDDLRFSIFAKLDERKGVFRNRNLPDFQLSLQLVPGKR